MGPPDLEAFGVMRSLEALGTIYLPSCPLLEVLSTPIPSHPIQLPLVLVKRTLLSYPLLCKWTSTLTFLYQAQLLISVETQYVVTLAIFDKTETGFCELQKHM